MSEAAFRLTYDGPAVEDGTMDVRDLAPALLGVGQLIEATNCVLNGEAATAKVRIQTVRPGSFDILLHVDVSFLQTIRDVFAGDTATAAANILQILTGGSAITLGAIGLIRHLRGRRPSLSCKTEGRLIEVEIDGTKIEVDEPVVRVALDVNVRMSLERVVAEPLSKEGIDAVEIGDAERVERIDKGEGYSFLSPPDREAGVFESKYRTPFSIVSLSFKEGNKWRLHDGKSGINATVEDQDFLARVNHSDIAFSKGDILICDVRVITRQEPKGLKAEYFIERVIEHRPARRHPDFFGDSDERR